METAQGAGRPEPDQIEEPGRFMANLEQSWENGFVKRLTIWVIRSQLILIYTEIQRRAQNF